MKPRRCHFHNLLDSHSQCRYTKCDFHGLWLDEVAGWRDGEGVDASGGGGGETLEVRMLGELRGAELDWASRRGSDDEGSARPKCVFEVPNLVPTKWRGFYCETTCGHHLVVTTFWHVQKIVGTIFVCTTSNHACLLHVCVSVGVKCRGRCVVSCCVCGARGV